MSVFLAKRLATFLATLAVASLLVFAVLELLPGNVAQVMLGETATPQAVHTLEVKLGLDKPPALTHCSFTANSRISRIANQKLGIAMPIWLAAITPTSPSVLWRDAA